MNLDAPKRGDAMHSVVILGISVSVLNAAFAFLLIYASGKLKNMDPNESKREREEQLKWIREYNKRRLNKSKL